MTSKPAAVIQSRQAGDEAAPLAEEAGTIARTAARQVREDLTEITEEVARESRTLLGRAAKRASTLAEDGVKAVREGSDELQKRARHASDITIDHIRDQPVKAIVIAAAVGATLIALLSLLRRSPERA